MHDVYWLVLFFAWMGSAECTMQRCALELKYFGSGQIWDWFSVALIKKKKRIKIADVVWNPPTKIWLRYTWVCSLMRVINTSLLATEILQPGEHPHKLLRCLGDEQQDACVHCYIKLSVFLERHSLIFYGNCFSLFPRCLVMHRLNM